MSNQLIKRLPDVRGDYELAIPMARHTWFGVGGSADVIYCPRDADDLADFMADQAPLIYRSYRWVQGQTFLSATAASPGWSSASSKHMKNIGHDGQTVSADAGALDADVARYARRPVSPGWNS